MKNSRHNTTYLAPKVTVVAFTVESGFLATGLKAEPQSEESTIGTEDVTEGYSLGTYFPRGN